MNVELKRRTSRLGGIALAFLLVTSGPAAADDSTNSMSRAGAEQSQAASEPDDSGSDDAQDALNKALDSTATQWSFQFAYQVMPDYHQDTLDNGQTRPVGSTDYLQARIVAPVPLKGFTILPRLTLRHYENAQGQSGLGNTEIFALIIPSALDWGSGRTGIGPLITVPGNKNVARDEWGYGFAAAVVNGSGSWFYGLLFTQTWRGIDPTALPPGNSDTNPLGIAPFLNFQLGGGWYVGNGDMVALYDWDSKKFYLPIGVRFGKVIVKEKGSWEHLRGVPDEFDLQRLARLCRQELVPLQRDVHDAPRLGSLRDYAAKRFAHDSLSRWAAELAGARSGRAARSAGR